LTWAKKGKADRNDCAKTKGTKNTIWRKETNEGNGHGGRNPLFGQINGGGKGWEITYIYIIIDIVLVETG
jgi:hypothetical protein